MDKMIATCGHEINYIPDRAVAVKWTIHGGFHTISWQTLCRECIIEYRREGLLLETTREQDDWLHSGETAKPERYR